MSTNDFDKIAELTFRSDNKRSRAAVRMVVVDEVSQADAARAVGATDAAVSMALKRFRKTAEIFSR